MLRGNIEKADEPVENFMRIWKENNGEFELIVMPSVRGSWKSYYQNISDVLNRGDELAVKAEECRKCMYVFDAALKSNENKKVEKVLIPLL